MGNCFERRFEREWQRHQRAMEVNRWQCTVFFDNRVYTGKPLQQPSQRPRYAKQDPCACGGHQIRVPAKLDRVPQSLLAMKQNGLAVQCFFAQPKRLTQISFGSSRFLRPPSAFVELEA